MIREQFIRNAKVLIVDSSVGALYTQKMLFIEMGFHPDQIRSVRTVDEAKRILNKQMPNILLLEYEVPESLNFSLSEEVQKDLIFILVTRNSTRASVAKAAEKGVNQIILKPFLDTDYKIKVIQAIEEKLNPSTYSERVNQAKAHLLSGDLSAGVEILEACKKEYSDSALACFYLAEAATKRNDLEKAEAELIDGLFKNEFHFKSLQGLHENLMLQKRPLEAYRVLKKVILTYPEDALRLTKGIQLAFETKHYRDVQVYHRIYSLIRERTDGLKRSIVSALAVYGRFQLGKKNKEEALTHFALALKESNYDQSYIDYVSTSLREQGLEAEMKDLLQAKE